jgi:hypothetical protein
MMASIYMRVTPTGHEVFGSIPMYYPLEGSSGQGNTTDLWADFPLPTLPVKPVRPGDTWQSRFQQAHLDLNRLWTQTSLVQNFPAAGEFVDVEWEGGHPCAKLKNTIEASELSQEDKKLLAQGAEFAGDKVKEDETIWFALDTHKVLKILRDEVLETKTQAATGGFGPNSGMGGPGMGPGRGMMPGSGGPGMPGPGGFGGGNKGGGDWTYGLGQLRRGGFPGGGGPAGFGPPGYGGMRGGPNSAPGAGGAGAATQSEYVRLHIQQIFTLEH